MYASDTGSKYVCQALAEWLIIHHSARMLHGQSRILLQAREKQLDGEQRSAGLKLSVVQRDTRGTRLCLTHVYYFIWLISLADALCYKWFSCILIIFLIIFYAPMNNFVNIYI